jgi:repressor LexA
MAQLDCKREAFLALKTAHFLLTADELERGEPRRSRRAARPREVELPIVGTIPAGHGDPADPGELGTVRVDLGALKIVPNARTFALRVSGDSMRDAGIFDGDLVIIEGREPRPGDIVAALIDGGTTLKRLVVQDGQAFLKAENPRYPDLLPARELLIQGVVRAVVGRGEG